jgi:hypothetical protein
LVACFPCNQTFFSGNAEDWDTWRFLFEANAVSYGYDIVLDGTDAVAKQSEVKRFEPQERDATELKKMQLYKLNSLAMVHLIKSMNSKTSEGKVAIGILKKTASDDYPTGNAYLGFLKLKCRFASKLTGKFAFQLDRELGKRRQRLDEDPDTYITELELIRYRNELLNSSFAVTDKDFCTTVLEGLNKDYQSFALVHLAPSNVNNSLQSIDDLRGKLNRCNNVGAFRKRSRHHGRLRRPISEVVIDL